MHLTGLHWHLGSSGFDICGSTPILKRLRKNAVSTCSLQLISEPSKYSGRLKARKQKQTLVERKTEQFSHHPLYSRRAGHPAPVVDDEAVSTWPLNPSAAPCVSASDSLRLVFATNFAKSIEWTKERTWKTISFSKMQSREFYKFHTGHGTVIGNCGIISLFLRSQKDVWNHSGLEIVVFCKASAINCRGSAHFVLTRLNFCGLLLPGNWSPGSRQRLIMLPWVADASSQ